MLMLKRCLALWYSAGLHYKPFYYTEYNNSHPKKTNYFEFEKDLFLVMNLMK